MMTALGLPKLRLSKGTTDDQLRVLTGLYQELVRRETRALATPEEARRANTELRLRMRDLDNYRSDLEELADDLVRSIGHHRRFNSPGSGPDG
jgi:hypothetical protein